MTGLFIDQYLLSLSNDVNVFALLWSLDRKLDNTIGLREQCVVLATANVGARVKLCATLTNNDIAGNDFLTTKNFYTEAFAF